MLATSSCSDDRGGHELAVRAGHVAGREGVLIKEGQMTRSQRRRFDLGLRRRMGNLRYASPCCRPATVQIDPLTMIDERETDAH